MLEFELVSVATIDSDICDLGLAPEDFEELGPCEPFLSTFCLREETNTQNSDTGNCPLGRNDAGIIAYTPDDLTMRETRPGLPNGPVNQTITSQHPWPVRFYRLYYNSYLLNFIAFSVILIIGDISVIH